MQLAGTASRFLPVHRLETGSLLFAPRHIFFLVLHIPLALLMNAIPEIASIHAWASAGLAVVIALNATRVESLIYAAAYVAGCEVLWRMTQAQVFWETGKYLTILVISIGLLRFRSPKWSAHPAIYFCLLLPATFITIAKLPPLEAKDALSFNLSGPLAFTLCALFFSRLWLVEKDLQRLLFVLIGPVAGIATLTIYSTLTATEVVFTGTQSVLVTSAGFGPNQVSAILGLGGLFCFLLFLNNQSARTVSKFIMIGGWAIFTLESAMTYSRGGIYMEFAAIGVASYYSLKEKSVKFRLLFFLLLIVVLGMIGTIPYLDSITSGTFSERYSSVDSTGRDSLIMDDLTSFSEHPFFGIGVGISSSFRTKLFGVAPHTEYTRALSEHGMLGFFAIVMFFFMLYRRWRESDTSKPVMVSFIVWGLLFLAVYATRLVAPLFLLALTFATILPDENPVNAPAAPLDVVDSNASLYSPTGPRKYRFT